MRRICIICNEEFQHKCGTQKCCSFECSAIKNKQRVKRAWALEKTHNKKTAVCIVCSNAFLYHYRKDRGERKFCGRSCASIHYIKTGAFDAWRLRKQICKGTFVKCLSATCTNVVYIPPRYIERKQGRTCSRECHGEHMSDIMTGNNNPMFGVTMSLASKTKQLTTLQSHYPNIANAFQLARHRQTSKPQIEIHAYLCDVFPHLNFQLEKFNTPTRRFFDIVSFEQLLVVEFFGDYWHCNPQIYNKDFIHPTKRLSAATIWADDKKRLDDIRCNGFDIIVMWGNDFEKHNWKFRLFRIVEEHAKNKDIHDLRSSVSSCSADVKSGELLETHLAMCATARSETTSANAKKHIVWQSAAEPLYRNVGEGSETTVSLTRNTPRQ